MPVNGILHATFEFWVDHRQPRSYPKTGVMSGLATTRELFESLKDKMSSEQ
jgi:hypothetical protein